MHRLRRLPSARIGLTILWFLAAANSINAEGRTRWVSVQEIYSKGKHNAWPDLCRWRGKYYVVFPGHGAGHGSPHGVVILESTDAVNWTMTLDVPHTHWQLDADETWPAETLFFLPTENRLYMLFWASAKGNTTVSETKRRQLKQRWIELGGSEASWNRWVSCHEQSNRSRVTYTEDGRTWEQPRPILGRGWWLWRPQTYAGRHYLVGFRSHAQEWEILSLIHI